MTYARIIITVYFFLIVYKQNLKILISKTRFSGYINECVLGMLINSLTYQLTKINCIKHGGGVGMILIHLNL